jgi:hypothetical protein
MQVLLLTAGDQTPSTKLHLRYPVYVLCPGTCPTTPHRTMVVDCIVLLFCRAPRTKAELQEAGNWEKQLAYFLFGIIGRIKASADLLAPRTQARTHRHFMSEYYSRGQKSIAIMYGPTMYMRIKIAQTEAIARKRRSTTHHTKSLHTTSVIPQSAWQS